MSKIFLDTNILIYTLQKQDTRLRRKARNLLQDLQSTGQGVISTQVMQEFYVVATRKLFVDAVLAKRIVQKFENYEVVVVTPNLIYEAMELSVANAISFWDGLIVSSARIARCEIVWTEDLNPGQLFGDIRIENPFH